TTPVTTVTLPASTASVNVYVKPIKAENITLSAVDNSSHYVTSGSQAVTVTAAAPDSVILTGPTVIVPGLCSPPYTVTLADVYLNSTPAVGSTDVNLGTSGNNG